MKLKFKKGKTKFKNAILKCTEEEQNFFIDYFKQNCTINEQIELQINWAVSDLLQKKIDELELEELKKFKNENYMVCEQ